MIRPYAFLRIAIPLGIFYGIYLHISRSQPISIHQDLSTLPIEIAIPKTVHQLFIGRPEKPAFDPNSHTKSWQQSGWKIEYWNEESCMQVAKDVNATGALSNTFHQLPTPILKSDFCRYLIMYGKGGIYNDLDVHLVKALPWSVMGPSERGEEPPKLIVGLEGDAKTTGLPRSPQFVQWTMAASPSHPVLRNVLNKISDLTPSFLKKFKDTNGDMDVMNWTGPGLWTDTVLEYLDCTDEQVQQLRDLKTAIRIKDVLVLPKRAFAVIQGDDHTSPDILVKHYFAGSWKTCSKSWVPWSC